MNKKGRPKGKPLIPCSVYLEKEQKDYMDNNGYNLTLFTRAMVQMLKDGKIGYSNNRAFWDAVRRQRR